MELREHFRQYLPQWDTRLMGWQDWLWDRWRGVETGGEREVYQLGVYSGDLRHFRKYQPSRGVVIRRSLKLLQEVVADLALASFVDVGCGKGRVLIHAAELPFKSLLGIDVSPELISRAHQNMRRLDLAQRVELRCDDIRRAALPTGQVVYYLFNPFDGVVMKEFLRRIPFHSSPGDDVTILYINPLRSFLLHREGWEFVAGDYHPDHNHSCEIFRRAF